MVQIGALLVVSVRILCCSNSAIAQSEDIDPEPRIVEPIITEEAIPNEPQDWDLRFSESYAWQGTAGTGLLSRSQFFIGIAKRWGGDIEETVAFTKEATKQYGIGDISTSLKYLVRKPGARMPGFVLGLEMAFPSGNAKKGLGGGTFEAAPFVAVVHASRWLVLKGNFGYSLVHRNNETDASNLYNTAVAYCLEALKSYLLWEINGVHNQNENRATFFPRWKYSLTPERFLAIALPIGLTSHTPPFGVVLQLQGNLHSGEIR